MTTTQVAKDSAPYFWLMHNGSPSGPFDVPQVHAKLVAGEICWQTLACAVGTSTWLPLVQVPDLGPAAKPSSDSERLENPDCPMCVTGEGRSQLLNTSQANQDLGQPPEEMAALKKGDTPRRSESSEEILSPAAKRNMLLLFGVGMLLLVVIPGFGSTLSSGIVWLMAGISLVVGWFVFGMFCEPGKDEDRVLWQGVGACLFTGVVGVFTLFIFQELALWASTQTISGGGRLKALLVILKVIGGSYRIAFDESQGLWMTLGAMLLSVGPCEELVKLLPAVGFGTDWGVSPRRRALGRDTLFIGAMSGLGFGIAEGIHYSYQMYLPLDAPLSIYVFRFFGIAYMHGMWTMLAVAALSWMRSTFPDRNYESISGVLIIILFAITIAIPHALYNAFVREAVVIAMVINAIAILMVCRVGKNADALLVAASPPPATIEHATHKVTGVCPFCKTTSYLVIGAEGEINCSMCKRQNVALRNTGKPPAAGQRHPAES